MMSPVYRADDAIATQVRANWGSLTWMAGKAIGNASGLTLGRVVIKRGEANPRHMHDNCEEGLYLLAGQLEHSIGDHRVILDPGDTLIVRAGEYHNAVNIGHCDADMIVVYSSAERHFAEEP